jgi:hypothetical protein
VFSALCAHAHFTIYATPFLFFLFSYSGCVADTPIMRFATSTTHKWANKSSGDRWIGRQVPVEQLNTGEIRFFFFFFFFFFCLCNKSRADRRICRQVPVEHLNTGEMRLAAND